MRAAPDCALDDEIVTIRPQRASSMSGTAACRQWKVPVRLTASDALPALERDLGEALERVEPGAVTMIAMGPSSARTLSSAASTAPRSVTSASTPIAGRPPRASSSAARSAASPWRSSRPTRSPRGREVPGDRQPHPRRRAGDHGDPIHRSHRSGASEVPWGCEYGSVRTGLQQSSRYRRMRFPVAGPPIDPGTWRDPDGSLPETGRGHLDRALSRPRHGARLVRGLDLARVLRARARGHLPAGLAQRRAGRAAAPERQLLHQGPCPASAPPSS